MVIVRCESCAASYRIPPERIGERGAKVKCPGCGAFLRVRPPGAPSSFEPPTEEWSPDAVTDRSARGAQGDVPHAIRALFERDEEVTAVHPVGTVPPVQRSAGPSLPFPMESVSVAPPPRRTQGGAAPRKAASPQPERGPAYSRPVSPSEPPPAPRLAQPTYSPPPDPPAPPPPPKVASISPLAASRPPAPDERRSGPTREPQHAQDRGPADFGGPRAVREGPSIEFFTSGGAPPRVADRASLGGAFPTAPGAPNRQGSTGEGGPPRATYGAPPPPPEAAPAYAPPWGAWSSATPAGPPQWQSYPTNPGVPWQPSYPTHPGAPYAMTYGAPWGTGVPAPSAGVPPVMPPWQPAWMPAILLGMEQRTLFALLGVVFFVGTVGGCMGSGLGGLAERAFDALTGREPDSVMVPGTPRSRVDVERTAPSLAPPPADAILLPALPDERGVRVRVDRDDRPPAPLPVPGPVPRPR